MDTDAGRSGGRPAADRRPPARKPGRRPLFVSRTGPRRGRLGSRASWGAPASAQMHAITERAADVLARCMKLASERLAQSAASLETPQLPGAAVDPKRIARPAMPDAVKGY